jgi:hypothetical protein
VTLTPPVNGLAQAAHELDHAEHARLREELAKTRSELEITRTKLEGTENTLAEVRVRAGEVSRALLMIESAFKERQASAPAEDVHDAVIVEERAAPPAPAPEAPEKPRRKWWQRTS